MEQAKDSSHFLPAKPFSSILGLPKWTPYQEENGQFWTVDVSNRRSRKKPTGIERLASSSKTTSHHWIPPRGKDKFLLLQYNSLLMGRLPSASVNEVCMGGQKQKMVGGSRFEVRFHANVDQHALLGQRDFSSFTLHLVVPAIPFIHTEGHLRRLRSASQPAQ